MIRRKRAVEMLGVLREIDRALVCFYDGEEEPDTVIEKLHEKIGELRDALWHEMPRETARQMDEDEGLPAGRGEWP